MDNTLNSEEKIKRALAYAFRYGQIDGDHHKAWVIDQMVRTLLQEKYADWVKEFTFDEESGEQYEWDEGIPP